MRATILIQLPLPENNAIVGHIKTVLPFLDLDNGPWVAGGIGRRLIEGENEVGNSDIDMFSPNLAIHDWACQMIRNHKQNYKHPLFTMVSETKHPKSNKFELKIGDETIMFQLVKGSFYETAEQMFDSFDITACMIATDGESLIADEKATKALSDRVLVLHQQPTRPLAARLAKYCAYGFTPGPGVLKAMIGVDLPNFKPSESLTHDEY